jgi:hypothetical protein
MRNLRHTQKNSPGGMVKEYNVISHRALDFNKFKEG